jgi:hypothetical protein
LIGGDGSDSLMGGRGRDTIDWDLDDAVAIGENLLAGGATPEGVFLDPLEVVTPELCPPEPETCI